MLKLKKVNATQGLKVGVLGLGNIGQGLVKNLLHSGHQVSAIGAMCMVYLNLNSASLLPVKSDFRRKSDYGMPMLTFFCFVFNVRWCYGIALQAKLRSLQRLEQKNASRLAMLCLNATLSSPV